MEPTRIRRIWSEGGRVLNCWLTGPSAVQAEQLAALGFDSLLLDVQHGDVDYREAVGVFTAIRASGATPLARVPWNDPGTIMRLLDAGAFGILCPMIQSRADAEAFVGACRYPPVGYRSCGPVRAQLHAGTDLGGYFDAANDVIVTIALIETARALDNLDEVLATPGLDAVYLGPSDLAISHGGPPAIDYFGTAAAARHECFLEAVRRHRVRFGLHAVTDEDLRYCIESGADLVTVTTDAVALLREASRQLSEARALLD
jgi:4-hydroxy-2-oxoheptanedioate aldolase